MATLDLIGDVKAPVYVQRLTALATAVDVAEALARKVETPHYGLPGLQGDEIPAPSCTRASEVTCPRSSPKQPTGVELPRFVVKDFTRYLECGVLAHGFARLACKSCSDEVLVPFSCKTRGVCPSCNARRAQDTAIHPDRARAPPGSLPAVDALLADAGALSPGA